MISTGASPKVSETGNNSTTLDQDILFTHDSKLKTMSFMFVTTKFNETRVNYMSSHTTTKVLYLTEELKQQM